MKFFTLIAALPFALSYAPNVHQLESVPDALSVTLPTDESSAEVSYKLDGSWSNWTALEIDNEQDPLLRESNLAMFPPLAEAVRVRTSDGVTVHPIDIDEGPVSYKVAATSNTGTPRILSRDEWGADESLLYRTSSSSNDTNNAKIETGDNGGATEGRIDDCEMAQVNYPNEFKTIGRMTTDETGQRLRWTHEYSPSVKLIAIHHTAVAVGGDKRSGAERVRAIYAYHANNRGWGDVGYHFLIDEDGQVYEGKAGGKSIVAGHAYCNNVGTLGVALLGNFEEEKPTQKQLKALQWLIADLGDEYDIDLEKKVKFHGKTMEPVVGHRDLISTACPGFFIYSAIPQMLANAANGDVTASVKLPSRIVATKSSSRTIARRSSSSAKPTPYATGTLTRAARRLLNTQASNTLRRKLGSNAGKEVEDGVAVRLAARKKSSSSVRSRRFASASSVSSVSSRRSVRSQYPSSRSSRVSTSTNNIRIRLTRQENGATSCDAYDLATLRTKYRGAVACSVIDGKAALINTLSLEDYMLGLAEEPDTEPYEKQRAFAIAARTYALYYMDPNHLRKFPGMPYDGSDSPATFQLYTGKAFEGNNPHWLKAVQSTANQVLMKDGKVIRAPYYSANDGRTRTPEEAGWKNFPFAEIFTAKDDPWCIGDTLRGHGVGMSGCGAKGQANDGKSGEDILTYYYPGTTIERY